MSHPTSHDPYGYDAAREAVGPQVDAAAREQAWNPATGQPNPGFRSPEPHAPQPAKRRSRLPWIIAAAAAGLIIIALIITVAALATSRPTAGPEQPLTAWEQEQAQRAGEDPTLDEGEILPDPTTEAPGPALAKSDLLLSLKTTDKECFGSAGCLVTVKVVATHADGPGSFNSPDTYLVTYEISGGEDGVVIGSFEVVDGTYDQQEETLQTPSSKTKLKVKVTDVEKVGI